MTLKRIVSLIIIVPIAIVLLAFIAANRAMVSLTLNPFQNGSEAFTYRAPFFIWLFLFLIIGILLAGTIGWFKQLKCRRTLRQTQLELEKLKRMTNHEVAAPISE